MNPFRLALAQMTSGDDVAVNLAEVERAYAFAAAGQAHLIVYPENTLFFRIRSGSPVKGLALDGPELRRLREMVDGQGTALMLTTPVSGRDGKLRNSTLFLRPGAEPEEVYTKIHLFDVDVAGAPAVRESEQFEAGVRPALIGFEGWSFGLSICYDLRFAELYARYSQKADILFVPSAFLVPTGEAHWLALLRARAIENQCYVVAPAQAGEHRSGGQVRQTYGHSLVVDPWGKVELELACTPEVRLVDLDKAAIERVRRQIPMSSHRRL